MSHLLDSNLCTYHPNPPELSLLRVVNSGGFQPASSSAIQATPSNSAFGHALFSSRFGFKASDFPSQCVVLSNSFIDTEADAVCQESLFKGSIVGFLCLRRRRTRKARREMMKKDMRGRLISRPRMAGV